MKNISSVEQVAPQEDHDDHSPGSEHHHEGQHRHAAGHTHAHFPTNLNGSRSLAFNLALVLTGGFVVIEFIAGFSINSLALISDAGHNLTDALALAFSWAAIRMARRAPNSSKTYGYHRAGILAATLNSVTLVLIALYIFYEGLQRLLNPPPVEGWTVVGVASIALVVNLTVAGLLLRWSKEDLNTRSAFIHILGDAAASVGVIIAGLVEVVIGWRTADPLISMVIGLLILYSSWGIIKEATNILLEGIPAGLDMVRLMRDLMAQPGVSDVHDLHVWTIGSGFQALSCHIRMTDATTLPEANRTVHNINELLETRHGIRHATIQVDCQACNIGDAYCSLE